MGISLDNVCVIGLGRVGLPLSLAIAEAGFKVFGHDIDESVVSQINQKKMPFREVNADILLKKHTNLNFFPSTDSSSMKNCAYIIICLGTPVDEHLNPDYSQINAILDLLKKNLSIGQTLIFRSTVAPGTTEFIKDNLERSTQLLCGKDFFMAFCPERIAEGNAIVEIKVVPQIIGGITQACSNKAKSFFDKITYECLVTDAKSAELAKLFTNMYRYINFAISNEFAIIASEHDRQIHEITHLVNHNYKRGGLPYPGFTAGPCLYKDGFFMLNNIPFAELITSSWRINEGLPNYLLQKIKKEYGSIKGKKAVILGLSFKKNHDDTRNSLSFKLKKSLIMEQCEVKLHDPFVKGYDQELSKVLEGAEIIIIATNHDIYKSLSRKRLSELANNCIVCDIWNITGERKLIYDLK
ncbi:MAG: nucleotide sugar dehydrogenase [archaeon]